MRFEADGPAIPDILLDERDAGNVVFLCGAGVSIPAGMPNFLDLARHVVGKVDPPQDSEIRKVLETFDDTHPPVADWSRPSLDRVFQWLYEEYGREQVATIVWRRLNRTSKTPRCRPCPVRGEHGIIARLSTNAEGHPQIVTTNFDRLFEAALGKQKIPRYEPPMYPDLRHVPPTGITYLHGRLADRESDTHNYILSSADLGRAYLAEGWATKFVRDLLQRYSVVLLGYRAEDPPVSYLLQGLESVGRQTPKRLFAFDIGDPEDVDAKWKDRGVNAIPYGNNHQALWETLEAWAKRADDPAAWRNAVVQKSSGHGPRKLKAHERGMVAHLVRSTAGAKQFANAGPPPPAEWLCVFDVACRYAKPASFGEDPPFDPLEIYGLDDDPPRSHAGVQHTSPRGDDLISWRRGDDSVDHWQRLSRSWGPQYDPMSQRLEHLADWLVSCLNDPVLAWWAARQDALHPTLHLMLKAALEDSTNLTDKVRQGWIVLLEDLKTPSSADPPPGRLQGRIREHGWKPDLIRGFEATMKPTFQVRPLRAPPPKSTDWKRVEWKDVANLVFLYPPPWVSRPEVPDLAWPKVPADVLPSVYAAIERNLMRASERLREVGEIRWNVDDEHPDYRPGWDAYVNLFRELLDCLSTLDRDRVKQHISLWPDPDPHMFDRLRLYVWSKSSLFCGTEAGDHVRTLSDDRFWRDTDSGELRNLLCLRWADFPDEQRPCIGQRILVGPPHQHCEEEVGRQAIAAWRFGLLVQAGCAFPNDLVDEWKNLKGKLPRWLDSWVDDAMARLEDGGVRDGETDEDASVLVGVPTGDIVRLALEHSGRAAPFVDKQAFAGLVETRPGLAIRALGAAARRGEFPENLWSSALRHWPDSAPQRATKVLHGRLRKLPPATIVAMADPVGYWLERRFPEAVSNDRDLAFEVFDHLTESLSTTGPEGSGRSIGKAVEGLIQAFDRDNSEQAVELPKDFKVRVERLLSASGEGEDHAVYVLSRRAGWLKGIDPVWVKQKMVPWFDLCHVRAKSAWNGILEDRASIRLLFDEIKDGFFDLPKRMDEVFGEEMEKLYCQRIVDLALPSGAGEEGVLSFEDARKCLREITPEGREHVISCLCDVGLDIERIVRKRSHLRSEGIGIEHGSSRLQSVALEPELRDGKRWQTLVIPFIHKAWPNERQFRTSGTTGAWLQLLGHTHDAFPDVFRAISKHLGAIDRHQPVLFSIEGMATKFPEQALDLLNRVVPPDEMEDAPSGLSEVLDLLVKAKPALNRDGRYNRLQRLAAQE